MKICICGKGGSAEQGNTVAARLTELHIPVIGTVGFHCEIQSSCLTGRRLNLDGAAAAEVARITGKLLSRHSRDQDDGKRVVR
ncbi:MAG: hypothetical protein C4520_05185 [Candidatus Abyssobacteria bacterium SURF_5]|uniref:Uncharacterized protein n=1 Tax=Abyssobacteria bacterium (strain SURF_5) TaxID=2093360 RepID=A0A3A4NY95_ABYX5|nr:MAG: hypothetical protein C4520_05185 [Candidatus Abyssubacteria bacterium SURF_5]